MELSNTPKRSKNAKKKPPPKTRTVAPEIRIGTITIGGIEYRE
jgi:hypothetical protein